MADLFGDDFDENGKPRKNDDFGSWLEQAEKGLGKKLRTGDHLKVEILSIGKEESFVSTGTPNDAMLFTREILDETGKPKHKVGDIIEVMVVSVKGGEIRVSVGGSKSAGTDDLTDAYEMELPIEGKISEVVNGGVRVLIQGKTAFCPVSQIDNKFVQNAADYVGKKFDFLITQMDDKQRNIVISRRKLLDMQKAENEGAFMQKIQPGSILKGRVTRIEKFGAFVALQDGVEGLVHISEIGWSRIQDPSEVLRISQDVEVKLLKIEETQDGKLKISLSIKQAGGDGDPWMQVPMKFPIGTMTKGKVEKKETYGLFVNIAPGITGLLPKVKWRDAVDGAQYENKKRGDEVTVRIDEINFEEKKLSLGLPREAEDMSWQEHSGSSTKAKNMGTLADLFAKASKK